MLTTLFVVVRVVANPVSNVFQKKLAQRGASPIFIIAATHAILTLAVLPILTGASWTVPPPEFWTNMGICAVLAVSGNVLLVYALRRTDLSILGPTSAYKAVISLVPGVLLLGEVPTALGALGIILVLAGSSVVVERVPGRPRGSGLVDFFTDRGVQLRLAALALSATEAVFLKRAILHASPGLTFILWSIFGLPLAAAVAVAVWPRGTAGEELTRLGQQWQTYLWLALMTGLMQAATLFTFGKLQVGYSLALFQLSTLISVFLGHRYFAERNVRRRLMGSVIMIAGAVLIVWLGRGDG
jgi:drug/metabolite transporter (DMT)-like permease